MRPVALPANPAIYNANAVSGARCAYEDPAGTTTVSTQSGVAADLRVLIDSWINQGAHYSFAAPASKVSSDGDTTMGVQDDDDEDEEDDEDGDEAIVVTAQPSPVFVQGQFTVRVPRFADLANLESLQVRRKRFKPNYGTARRDLITALGQYCSYCESPVFSHLHVEHRLPKASFPERAYLWPNFLLACSSCNSTKGNDPSQLWGAGVPVQPTDASVTRLDDAQNVAWPSLYADRYQDGAILPVQYQLYRLGFRRDQHAWHEIATPDDLAEIDAAYGDGPVTPRELELDEDEAGGTVLIQSGVVRIGRSRSDWKRFAMRVEANPNLSPADRAAVAAMIELTGLDRIQGTNRNASVDRRTELRTLAFLRARYLRREWDRLVQANPAPAQPLIDSFQSLLAVTIANTGYWGVWLSAFQGIPGAQTSMAAVFTGTHPRNWAI